jgi:nucleotide-binding universal stress UspA family protein
MFRILVPLDGSRLAEGAVPYVIEIARRTKGGVDIVFVQTEASAHALAAGRVEEPLTVAEEYLQHQAAALTHYDIGGVTFAVDTGRPVDAICARARRLGVDLIVMTTHGRTGFSRAWIGSVADGVVRQSATPVLLLRAAIDDSAPPHTPVVRYLVPLDGSKSSEQVLDAIAPLIPESGSITLLHVVQPVPQIVVDPMLPYATLAPTLPDEAATRELTRHAQEYVETVASRLRLRIAAPVETRVVVSQVAATSILDAAKDARADAIAMSTQGRGASRLLIGSVADKVLRAAAMPLLLYRPVLAKSKQVRGRRASRARRAGAQ